MLSRLVFAFLLAVGMAAAHANPLRDAYEAAAALNPELRALEVQRAATDARLRGANALTPGVPGAGLGYTTERLAQNRGFREAELEIGVPVRLPGQSRAQRGLADAEGHARGRHADHARPAAVAGQSHAAGSELRTNTWRLIS